MVYIYIYIYDTQRTRPGGSHPLRGMDIPIYAYIWIYRFVSLGPDLEISWSDLHFRKPKPSQLKHVVIRFQNCLICHSI